MERKGFLISKVRRLTSETREIERGEEKIKDGEGLIQAMQIGEDQNCKFNYFCRFCCVDYNQV